VGRPLRFDPAGAGNPGLTLPDRQRPTCWGGPAKDTAGGTMTWRPDRPAAKLDQSRWLIDAARDSRPVIQATRQGAGRRRQEPHQQGTWGKITRRRCAPAPRTFVCPCTDRVSASCSDRVDEQTLPIWSYAVTHPTRKRIRRASRRSIVLGLIHSGIDSELAVRWCELWEAEATRQGIPADGDYFWDAAKGWIDAHRASTTPLG